MQRVCFCKTISLFNHILQPSQALALFYQSLIFSLKNLTIIKWISTYIDIPVGLQLLMIDINGNVTIDNELFYKQLANIKYNIEETKDTTSIVKWLSRIVLRLATDHSISSKMNRSYEFETFNEFLKQFHSSFLLEDDELDEEEDINRHAIHQALIKCIDYITTNSSDILNSNSIEIQDFENNPIAFYNQQIIQILCSDTLELEIELARDSIRKSSLEISPQISINDNTLINYYSIWLDLWKNVTIEYLQFNNNKRSLKKILRHNFENENHLCLHDRLMFEIKQKRRLKPINKFSIENSHRKRIRPIEKLVESDSSSEDEYQDEYRRKRVAVINSILESSSSEDDIEPCTKKQNHSTVKNLELEHISMETLLQYLLAQ